MFFLSFFLFRRRREGSRQRKEKVLRDLFSRLEKKRERRFNLLFPFTRYSLLFLSLPLSSILLSFPFIFFILIISFHSLHPHLFFCEETAEWFQEERKRGKSNQLLSYLHTRCTDTLVTSREKEREEALRKKGKIEKKEKMRMLSFSHSKGKFSLHSLFPHFKITFTFPSRTLSFPILCSRKKFCSEEHS